jgi:hypothetical protein
LSETLNSSRTTADVYPLRRNEVHFGFDIAPEADAHLQRAAALVTTREASLQALNDARQAAPDQLEVLVAMFKFHFYQGETEKAEALVLEALAKASWQGGFSHDWNTLAAESADWSDPRGPGRLFLYSLKALAFIRLRQCANAEAASILDTMQRLDPTDQVGADVIRDLLEGVDGERDDG